MFERKAPGIVRDLMRDLGLAIDQACGLLGNVGHECCGFMKLQEVHPVAGRGGLGWGMWTGSRRVSFEAWCKAHSVDTHSDEGNYGYLVHELKTTESGSIAALKRETTLEGATRSFEQHFERAGVVSMGDRLTFAKLALAAYQKSEHGK